jgi:p24 family protein delta-1
MTSRISAASALAAVAAILLYPSQYTVVTAYPVIFQVDEGSERCFRFNIPQNEEYVRYFFFGPKNERQWNRHMATLSLYSILSLYTCFCVAPTLVCTSFGMSIYRAHMVAVVIPNEDEVDNDETLETWYVDQVFGLTKQRTPDHHTLQKELPNAHDMPGDVAQKMSAYLREHGGDDSHLLVQITATPASDPKNYHHKFVTKYFQPTVLNYVGATSDVNAGRYQKPDDNENLEGYGICLTNTHHSRHVQVIFDLVLTSDEILDDDVAGQKDKGRFTKEKHLTPLEQSLDQSINAANVVLREMNYMEKREARMRKTAESINSRVRWFSYLSVSVLLSVTYIQVTYLKRYFHKKKLM